MRTLGLILCLTLITLAGVALAEEPCTLKQVGRLPVTVGPGNRVLVDGEIGGTPVKFILDTGAGVTLMDGAALASFGVKGLDLPGSVYGVGGQARITKATIPDLKIGSYGPRSVNLRVAPDMNIGGGVAGLIGGDFLSNFDVEVDLADGIVNLFEKGRCPGKMVYWSEAFDTVPITFGGRDDPHVRLDVQVNGLKLEALLDTGAGRTVMSWDAARKVGVDRNSPGVESAGLSRGIDMHGLERSQYRFESFAIGDERIAHPTLALADIGRGVTNVATGSHVQRQVFTADMLLGADFLKAHRVMIAYGEGQLYLTYNGVRPVFGPSQAPAVPQAAGAAAR